MSAITNIRRFALLPILLIQLAAVLFAQNPADLEKQLPQAKGAERVELLLKLAEVYMYRSPDKVILYAQQAYEAAAGSPRDSARALLDRGTGYFQLSDLDHAEESYRQSLKLAEGLQDHLLIGGCLNGIAAVSLKRGQLDTSLARFTEAVSHLEKAPKKDKLAGVFNNISLIYYTKGQYDQSLEYMFKALRLYEEIGNDAGQGIVLNSIGNVYSKLSRPAEARANFERALAIAEKAQNKQLQVSCLVNIGEICIKQREWDAALDCLNRALPVARALGNREFISVCLNNIGDVLREKGDDAAALRHYLESLEIFEALNARPRLVVSYVNIGRLYLKMGKPSEAEAYLLKAFDLAGAVQEKSLQKDAAEALCAVYEQRGDYRRALHFQDIYNSIKEQIFSKENYEKLATIQGKYETEKKESEIKLLRTEREIEVLKVKRQRLWIVLIAIGLILLAGLAVLLYRRYRLKVRTNAELSAAYARMAELARHDDLTGLYNRRSATERLEIELARTSRTQRPFSLVMIDVDDFKRINDEHGHACGDAVLCGLAGLLADSIRAQDAVSRWGGEEFLLILPETSRDGALAVAEKLRQAIAGLRVRHEGSEMQFTVTMGVNTYDRIGSLSECIRLADEAMYEGKRNGKNQVVPAPA